MSDYREHYIYQLKKDNQVLWGSCKRMVTEQPWNWKAFESNFRS